MIFVYTLNRFYQELEMRVLRIFSNQYNAYFEQVQNY